MKEQDLLQRAINEIKQLRSQNSLMNARLDMFDKMMVLFHTQPAYAGGQMSPDLVWEMEKHLDSINENKQ